MFSSPLSVSVWNRSTSVRFCSGDPPPIERRAPDQLLKDGFSASSHTEGRLSQLRSPLRHRSIRATVPFPAPMKTSVLLQLFIGGVTSQTGFLHLSGPEASCDAQDLDILTQISSPWCRFNMKHARILCLSTLVKLLLYFFKFIQNFFFNVKP